MIYRILDAKTSCRITNIRKTVSCVWLKTLLYICVWHQRHASLKAAEQFYVNPEIEGKSKWPLLNNADQNSSNLACYVVSTAKQLQVSPRLLYPDDGGSTPLRNFCNYLPSTRRNIPKHLQRHNIAVNTSDFAELIKPNLLFWSECYCDLRNECGWLELANDALCSPVFQYVEFYRKCYPN